MRSIAMAAVLAAAGIATPERAAACGVGMGWGGGGALFDLRPEHTFSLAAGWDLAEGAREPAHELRLAYAVSVSGFGLLGELGAESLSRQGYDRSLGAGALGFAFRLSPTGMIAAGDDEAWVARWLDVYGLAGFTVGLAETVNSVALRGGLWLGIGAQLRFGIRAEQMPAIFVEARHGAHVPEWAPGTTLHAGLAWVVRE